MKGKVNEIWVLRHSDGFLVPPIDDDGTNVFLAWPTKEEAERGIRKQMSYYGSHESLTAERLLPAGN